MLRLALRRFRDIGDANGPVDPATFGHGDRLRIDVADDRRRGLDLESLGGADGSLDLPSDHRLTSGDVSLDLALATNVHLKTGANRAYDTSLVLVHDLRLVDASTAHTAHVNHNISIALPTCSS